MTSIAVRGPLEGVGSYTLKAPVTDSDLELEMPISGTHLSGANAEGMPQLNDGTPVVESGSNSDGDWVRWADGTQQVITIPKAHSAIDISYPSPRAFVGGSGASVSAFVTTIPTGSATTSAVTNVYASTLSSLQIRVAATSINTTFVTAIGRWK